MIDSHSPSKKAELQLAINQGAFKLEINPYICSSSKRASLHPLVGAFNREKSKKQNIADSIEGFVRATFVQDVKDTEHDIVENPQPNPRQVYHTLSPMVTQPPTKLLQENSEM